MEKKLMRSNNKMVSGVCGGLAEYFDVDPTVIRVIYALVTFFTGILVGVIAYLILCFIMPQK